MRTPPANTESTRMEAQDHGSTPEKQTAGTVPESMLRGKDTVVDLSGQWRFRTDPEDMGEHYSENLDEIWGFDARWMRPDYDDAEWAQVPVPACWQDAGYNYNGVAWYRRTVRLSEPLGPGERLWLRFDGVDYYCDAWCNGFFLGSHEGYFDRFEFEVTPFVRGQELHLAVRVDSPQDIHAKERQEWQLKSLFKGALQRWDVNNPLVNPGGIWNSVSLVHTGPVKIDAVDLRPALVEAPDRPLDERADARVTAVVSLNPPDVSAARDMYTVTLEILPPETGATGVTDVTQLPGTAGPLAVTPAVSLPNARLWYPWDMGVQPLYTAVVTVSDRRGVSDSWVRRFGIRSVGRRRGWETSINGHRVFQRGANYLSDQFLSRMDQNRYSRDVVLATEAHLNTLHPFCVVEKQEFYDECDRRGVLVYQDFPMWLMMSNTSDLVRRGAEQMHRLIAQFGHHASIFVWNCGSQPSRANFEKLGHALVRTAARLDPSRIAHHANALLDYTGLQEGVRRNPVGDFHWPEAQAHEFNRDYDWRTDTHQYFGWYYSKDISDLDHVPIRYLELVTEYGAQALPARAALERMIPDDDLFPPNLSAYSKRCFQHTEQFRYIPQPASLDEFVSTSQEYQARFVQYHTEYYRRHKFAPCNGAHVFCFNDCWPAITWSVLDYDRTPKLGYWALQRAMAPIQVLVEIRYHLRLSTLAEELSVWLVNDTDRRIDPARCTVSVSLNDSQLCRSEYSTTGDAEPPGLLGTLTLPCVGTERTAAPQTGDAASRLVIATRIEGESDRPLAENLYHYIRTSDGTFEFRGA